VIKFLPTKGVVKSTNIDYELLAWIFTKVFEDNFDRKLNLKFRIQKSRHKETSLIYFVSKKKYNIHLDCTSKNTLKHIISCLLHEVRHALQFVIFKYDVECEFTSYYEYYNSIEERDARRFEKLTTSITAIYNKFIESSKVFEKLNLKELHYNKM